MVGATKDREEPIVTDAAVSANWGVPTVQSLSVKTQMTASRPTSPTYKEGHRIARLSVSSLACYITPRASQRDHVMAFVYINHGSERPDVKIGSHEGDDPDARRRSYSRERGVAHEEQIVIAVPDGYAEDVERHVHRVLADKRVSNNTELFFVAPDEAEKCVRDALRFLLKVADVDLPDLNVERRSVSEASSKVARKSVKRSTSIPTWDLEVFDPPANPPAYNWTDRHLSDTELKEHFIEITQGMAHPPRNRKSRCLFQAWNRNGLVARYLVAFQLLGEAGRSNTSHREHLAFFAKHILVPRWPSTGEYDAACEELEAKIVQLEHQHEKDFANLVTRSS